MTICKRNSRIIKCDKDEIYFVPESLTFLKNGGRVSPAVAMIGNMLGIKPLLKYHDGEIQKQVSFKADVAGEYVVYFYVRDYSDDSVSQGNATVISYTVTVS